tara:strand:+ start:67 stop:348 length:282 start_codon:yes stop_codon:yes gene_type:complete
MPKLPDILESTATVALAEMIAQESSEMTSKCGFPPHLLAGALVFAAVRVALSTLEEKEEQKLSAETLQSLFSNAVENAYFLYTQTQESDKNLH